MNTKIFASFLILILILVIPSTSAQEINIAAKAGQKSVEVTIGDDGDIHVKHVVSYSNSPKQMDLIDGTIQNLTITDEEGEEQVLTIIGENDAVMISPSRTDSIIEYDLEDVMFIKDDYWTLDFLYLETTTFLISEKVDLIFVNGMPVEMNDKKGFACHGCQMILEYSFNEPKVLKNVKWEDREFVVVIKTHAEINGFNFEQSTKSIALDVLEENKFVTIIIPLELLWEPYTVFLDDEKIKVHKYMNNGTHVWLNMRPEASGEIVIIGTTVVPEFPIIAPLAIGFLMILVVPLIQKFNLR